MSNTILPGTNRAPVTIASNPYSTSLRKKTGGFLISGMLAFAFFFSAECGTAFAEGEIQVEVKDHTPPKLVSFAQYAKMTKGEKREIFKNTIIDLYIKLRQRGQNSRAQCMEDIFGHSNESILRLFAEIEAKANVEEKTPETKYKKTVPWHIARRMLEICPPGPKPVAR
ncbi:MULTISPECIES: hypothetical protein [unclassified Nitrospina]|uniref:hypothetical protein n=1 Tax=unclassified Nitrospina TaxID=2638683 RepID=UPI003F9C6004